MTFALKRAALKRAALKRAAISSLCWPSIARLPGYAASDWVREASAQPFGASAAVV